MVERRKLHPLLMSALLKAAACSATAAVDMPRCASEPVSAGAADRSLLEAACASLAHIKNPWPAQLMVPPCMQQIALAIKGIVLAPIALQLHQALGWHNMCTITMQEGVNRYQNKAVQMRRIWLDCMGSMALVPSCVALMLHEVRPYTCHCFLRGGISAWRPSQQQTHA